ncbi:PREDICTED: PRUPE_3G297500 [Prunus dulcis]|uniref:PREDICTED: PRUPE_3G297500 n=1 Tax=Prunus dulcis TaxID=3755 RepID=A0A5E4FWD1_PRUDU|nr:PREDICTED: PRUPE_3G297500 [Prunus dulcis]
MGVSDDDHARGAMHQSMETYKGKFIPATASAIKGLEKVRVKGLGLGADKVCVICMEGFEVGLGADKV